MNTARLLCIIGDVDPVFVDAAPIEEYMQTKTSLTWIKWIAAAACFLFVVGGGYGLYHYFNNHHGVVYPSENTPLVIADSESKVELSTYFGLKEPYTYSSLAAACEVIVVADVTESEVGNRTLLCRNYAYVSVREVLKGDVSKGDILCVAEPTTGMYSNNIEYPMMQHGNRVLLFLITMPYTRDNPQGENVPVYGFVNEYPSIGKFFFDRNSKYHEAYTYIGAPVVSTPLFTDYEPKTLEEIKKLIQAE